VEIANAPRLSIARRSSKYYERIGAPVHPHSEIFDTDRRVRGHALPRMTEIIDTLIRLCQKVSVTVRALRMGARAGPLRQPTERQ